MFDETRSAFHARWTAVRDAFAEAGALVDGARLLDRVLADVQALFASEADERLTLAQASRESGYSRDHLSRLIRTGAIPNAGRARAPRIRRADLPRRPAARPRAVAERDPRTYDPAADARSLVARRGG